MTLEARETESWGGEEEKESVAVEGADRAKGNRRSTYPHLHIFLSRVWRKRIEEYVSMSPEHNHTAREAYGRSASYSRRCRQGWGHSCAHGRNVGKHSEGTHEVRWWFLKPSSTAEAEAEWLGPPSDKCVSSGYLQGH